jgi:hypothetical protein
MASIPLKSIIPGLGAVSDSLIDKLRPGNVPNDLTLGQSKYNFNSRTFPSDIGSGFQGHFMVININVQTGSVMGKVNSPNGPSNFNFEPTEELSKTDALRYKIDNTWTSNGNSLGLNAEGFGTRARFTRRIEESIALYMPNSELTFSDAHDFENISLTKLGGSVASDLARFGASFLRPGAADAVGSIVDNFSKYGGSALQVVNNTPINPKVEVLFANTFQREFAFDFLFSPSNKKEADDLENIIRTIRFHAAPEYIPSTNQFFWLPPSEFDLTFYFVDPEGNIEENTKIPRINTCVLKQVDVSYAPSGAYSTFHDGHPVQVRMMLRFVETEVNSKLRIAQGF